LYFIFYLTSKEIGNKYFKAKEFHKAIKFYSKALKNDKIDLNLYSILITNISTSWLALNNPIKAFEALEGLLNPIFEKNPHHFKGILRMTEACNELKYWEVSIMYGNLGLKIEPKNEILINLVDIAQKNQKITKILNSKDGFVLINAIEKMNKPKFENQLLNYFRHSDFKLEKQHLKN